MKIMATTSLPEVDRPNADRWNAERSRQFKMCIAIMNKENMEEDTNSEVGENKKFGIYEK